MSNQFVEPVCDHCGKSLSEDPNAQGLHFIDHIWWCGECKNENCDLLNSLSLQSCVQYVPDGISTHWRIQENIDRVKAIPKKHNGKCSLCNYQNQTLNGICWNCGTEL